MLSARDNNGKVILARDVEKNGQRFFCPECGEELILKKGKINVHHFAHKANTSCSWGAGESEEHLLAKLKIYDNLKDLGYDVGVEVKTGNRIADVFCYDLGCVFEFQRSRITTEEYQQRTDDYYADGYNVVWLFSESNSNVWVDGYWGEMPQSYRGKHFKALTVANYSIQYEQMKKLVDSNSEDSKRIDLIYHYAPSQLKYFLNELLKKTKES